MLLAMSGDEETYSTVFSALRHPVRRRILRILARGPMSFSEIQRDVDIGSSHFNYHLDGLGELVIKGEDGRYRLSSSGRAALGLMEGVEEPVADMAGGIDKPRRLKLDLRPLVVGLVVGLVLGVVIPVSYTYFSDVSSRPTLLLNGKVFRSGDLLVFMVFNEGDSTLGLGQPYEIEYLFEGEWKAANWLVKGGWYDVLHNVPPGETFTQSLELFPVYEGSYRVTKEVWEGDAKGVASEVLTAEFRVEEGTPWEEIPEVPPLPESYWLDLSTFCEAQDPPMTKREVASWLKERFRETELVNSGFITGFGGGESFNVGVRHATATWVEQWPSQCREVEVTINVYSWALTELQEVWREEIRGGWNLGGTPSAVLDLWPEDQPVAFFLEATPELLDELPLLAELLRKAEEEIPPEGEGVRLKSDEASQLHDALGERGEAKYGCERYHCFPMILYNGRFYSYGVMVS